MEVTTFDQSWLCNDGPVALTITESLEPASAEEDPGKRVFFPPTYADPGGDKKKPYYVIDETSSGRVCLIDSVASQANRMEPIFLRRKKLAGLVPQVTIKVNDRRLDLLSDLGHRAADAVIRFSDHGRIIRQAFLAYRDKADAIELAKIAPTSLVFGAWDSRGDAENPKGTGVKLPRIVESTIRAYGIDRLTRASAFRAALTDEEQTKFGVSGNSEDGFANALSQSPGGIVAKGGIRRESLLNLVALRALGGPSDESTRAVQRYILGLALVAFLTTPEAHLRQGCVLVASEQPAKKLIVWRSGKRDSLKLTEDEAVDFAKLAANDFGVGGPKEAVFQPPARRNRSTAGAQETNATVESKE